MDQNAIDQLDCMILRSVVSLQRLYGMIMIDIPSVLEVLPVVWK